MDIINNGGGLGMPSPLPNGDSESGDGADDGQHSEVPLRAAKPAVQPARVPPPITNVTRPAVNGAVNGSARNYGSPPGKLASQTGNSASAAAAAAAASLNELSQGQAAYGGSEGMIVPSSRGGRSTGGQDMGRGGMAAYAPDGTLMMMQGGGSRGGRSTGGGRKIVGYDLENVDGTNGYATDVMYMQVGAALCR